MKKQIRNFVLLFSLSIVGFACSDSSVGPDSDPATINGRVEESGGSVQKTFGSSEQDSSVEGVVVTAARINADGSLETINGMEAETNAQGEFSLNLDLEAMGSTTDNLVIVAGEVQQWKAMIAGQLESGSSVELKPLSIESSGEVSVFQQLIASGEAGSVSKADIEAFVGTEVAAEVTNNTTAAAEVASALATEARARSESFASQSIEITEEQLNEIQQVKAEALAEYNASLYASAGGGAEIEAYDAFVNTVANVYIDAGVEASAYAKAREVAKRVLLKNLSELSTEARSEIRANAALIAGIAIDKAVQARLKAEDVAESSLDLAIQAGTTLRGDLKTKTTATQSEVDTLFDAYNEAVVEALTQEFSASAETIVEINSQINNSAGAKAILETSLEASASTMVIVQAYNTFYSAVETAVSEAFSNASGVEAELVTDVMILINIAN